MCLLQCFQASRVNVSNFNPEDIFFDDGSEIECEHVTTTTKKIHRSEPPDDPVVRTHDLFDKLSKVDDEAIGAEQSVCPCH